MKKKIQESKLLLVQLEFQIAVKGTDFFVVK